MFLLKKSHFSSAFVLLVISVSLSSSYARASATRHTAKEVLLVYNANSPTSMQIAKDYARKRRVSNIVVIHCIDSAVGSDNETIPLADFTREIELPISSFLVRHKGINFIVLTKGIPIRIDGGTRARRT